MEISLKKMKWRLETRPGMVPMCVLDSVAVKCIPKLQKYCTAEAWLLVQEVLNIKASQNVWPCVNCDKNLELSPSIGCDGCLSWIHKKCVGIRKNPGKH